MKKKEENSKLSARMKNNKENRSIPAHPLYSAGEDFYEIYHEENKIKEKSISKSNIT
ncbi:MAG: hypothetical protein GZ094_07375 [Mariniphaga sp.]|nr:hypothetical protein [Mariniphaga sp.]